VTEIDTSKTSREFDAEIARLIGWKLIPDPQYHTLGGAMFAVLPSGEKRFMWHLKENVYSGEKRWSPTYDIAAAFDVVEQMSTRFWFLGLRRHIGEWEAYFTLPINDPDFNTQQFGACAISAPLAICRAAYAALPK